MKRDTFTDIPAEQLGAETVDMVQALRRGSFAPAFKDCLDLAQKSIGVNFTVTAAPHGFAWPSRKKIGDGHPLLIESGKMFQPATGGFAEGSLVEIGDREASTGVDSGSVPYAATQNFGDPSRNIPQREFEDVDDATIDEMLERVADRGVELLL